MPFDERAFAADMVKHLRLLKKDIEILRTLEAEDRRKATSRVLNHLIDIKNVPEFVEAWALSYAVGMIEGFIGKQLGPKEEPAPGRGDMEHD